MPAIYESSICQRVKRGEQRLRKIKQRSCVVLLNVQYPYCIYRTGSGLSSLVSSSTTPGASWVPVKASTLNCGARGTTVAPSDCRAWLGWRGSVCCSHGGRFNSRWLPVCLFLVSVYLRLTPCLHVTHWHLPPAHIAEQASFLAGAAKKEKKESFHRDLRGGMSLEFLQLRNWNDCCLKKKKQVCVAASASASV